MTDPMVDVSKAISAQCSVEFGSAEHSEATLYNATRNPPDQTRDEADLERVALNYVINFRECAAGIVQP
jgi:hypothetical protein